MSRTNGERNFLEFYPDTRLDGLVSREERVGDKTIEIFEKRNDRLIYRSASCKVDTASSDEPGEGLHQKPAEIVKLTEKFSRDNALDGDADIAKRVFYLMDEKIRIDFHYGEGKITRSSRVFHKEGHSHIIRVKKALFTLSIEGKTQVNPRSSKPTPSALFEEFHHLLVAETNCLQVAFNQRLNHATLYLGSARSGKGDEGNRNRLPESRSSSQAGHALL